MRVRRVYLNLLLGLTVASSTAVAASAAAEELSGLVRIVGNAASSKVIVTPPTEFGGPQLCYGDFATRMRPLESMVVKFVGSWKKPEKLDKCFAATDFSVQQVSVGHDAVTGILGTKDGKFYLTTDDGQNTPLAEVPERLKKLVGKKVILGLRPGVTPAATPAASATPVADETADGEASSAPKEVVVAVPGAQVGTFVQLP